MSATLGFLEPVVDFLPAAGAAGAALLAVGATDLRAPLAPGAADLLAAPLRGGLDAGGADNVSAGMISVIVCFLPLVTATGVGVLSSLMTTDVTRALFFRADTLGVLSVADLFSLLSEGSLGERAVGFLAEDGSELSFLGATVPPSASSLLGDLSADSDGRRFSVVGGLGEAGGTCCCCFLALDETFPDVGCATLFRLESGGFSDVGGFSWRGVFVDEDVVVVVAAVGLEPAGERELVTVGGLALVGEGLLSLLSVSYTHLRAHETPEHLVCRLLLEKKKKKK
eukprot:TRINITY_DN11706_c0_g1_i4.p1 TRINITY_DN11706_c0_g1~~TRINITY_DN11706_c0_g1_i4.p1  ORF type:complete len:283 (+),score=22.51 TRINITY_DN11706_c0_g1_i4:706-1554(+)